jgi:hypothetical protein
LVTEAGCWAAGEDRATLTLVDDVAGVPLADGVLWVWFGFGDDAEPEVVGVAPFSADLASSRCCPSCPSFAA